jgi:hypothetical protein
MLDEQRFDLSTNHSNNSHCGGMHGAKIAMDSMNLLCNDVESNMGDDRGFHGRRGEFGQHKTMDDMAHDRVENRAPSSKQLVNSMV